jgi:putative PEP-CTERM system histidine kinase
VKAKEMEAFQTLSTFFVHDLKNLASTLSLTLENLPIHFSDPEFRTDTLRVITNSVNKINTMCSRLSLLTKGLELQKTSVDLNVLITATLADLNGSIRAALRQNLYPVPTLSLDPDQIQKVIMNLVLNASEAAGPRGEIRVTTEQQNGWAVLVVEDNGCGMSKEFIERSLFQPFQTTKSKGLGIGLFHSKKIVEAHHGRIEVESEPGKGSTFRVFLPAERV